MYVLQLSILLVDCQWSDWTGCCVDGKQTRWKRVKADFGGKECQGSPTKDCNLKPCPIDCKWGQWGPCNEKERRTRSSYFLDCIQGEQTRSKQVTAEFGGEDCAGADRRDCCQRK